MDEYVICRNDRRFHNIYQLTTTLTIGCWSFNRHVILRGGQYDVTNLWVDSIIKALGVQELNARVAPIPRPLCIHVWEWNYTSFLSPSRWELMCKISPTRPRTPDREIWRRRSTSRANRAPKARGSDDKFIDRIRFSRPQGRSAAFQSHPICSLRYAPRAGGSG